MWGIIIPEGLEPFYYNTGRDIKMFLLRVMEKNDMREVMQLHKDCFPVEYDTHFFAGLLNTEKCISIVATDPAMANGRLIGVVTGRWSLGEGYVSTLGVALSHRRLGVATALLESLVRTLENQRKCSSVYLHVKFGNESALAFYKKQRFVVEAKLYGHYEIHGVRYDAFLIRRKLHPPISWGWRLLRECLRRILQEAGGIFSHELE